MAHPGDLSATIRRQQNRKNLARYWHTRSFNQLAGRLTAPGSARTEPNYTLNRIVYCSFATLFLLIGLYGIWF